LAADPAADAVADVRTAQRRRPEGDLRVPQDAGTGEEQGAGSDPTCQIAESWEPGNLRIFGFEDLRIGIWKIRFSNPHILKSSNSQILTLSGPRVDDEPPVGPQ